MKKYLWIPLVLFLGTSLFAQDPTLKAIDDQVSFLTSDYSAEIQISQSKPDEGTTNMTVALFRRDKESKYLILFLKPEVDKGKGYLKINDFLWFYDPLSRRFTATHAKERFQNSNARNADFTKSSLAEDYRVVSVTRAKLGSLDTRVFELQATNDRVAFPKTKLWVTDDNLVRKSEDYSLSGQLLRTVIIPTYQKLGNKSVPNTITMTDNLKYKMQGDKKVYEKTVLTITKPNTNPLPDILFTKAYLDKNAK